MQKPKVLVIGLDGGSLELVKRWRNELPTFSRLLDEGASSPMLSTLPNNTPPAWTSFMTGKNPGKHGVFGFMERAKGSYEFVLAAPHRRPPSRTLWRIASEAGKRVIVLDMPMTFPPQEISGVMVSGLGTPSVKSDFIHPRERKAELLKAAGGYELDVAMPPPDPSEADVGAFIATMHKIIEQRRRLILHLLKEDWDLFAAVFTATDRAQHYLWRYMDGNFDVPGNMRAKYQDAIKGVYKRLDSILKEILEALDSSTCLIVCSDHGAGPLYGEIDMRKWLGAKGYQKMHDGKPGFVLGPRGKGFEGLRMEAVPPGSSAQRMPDGSLEVAVPESYASIQFKLRGLAVATEYLLVVEGNATGGNARIELKEPFGPERASDVLKRAACHLALRRPYERPSRFIKASVLGRAMGQHFFVITPRAEAMELMLHVMGHGTYVPGKVRIHRIYVKPMCDLGKSLAYSTTDAEGIFLNVRGREPLGVVEPGKDYDELRDRLVRELREERDGEGRPIFDKVFKREELYRGPFLGELPDIVCTRRIPPHAKSAFVNESSTGLSGMHEREGMLILHGDGVKKGCEFKSQITDLAPTILHLLGLEVPSDMDGEVLASALESPGKVRIKEAKEEEPTRPAKGAMSGEDEEQVKSRLKALGYLP